ncbi:hypothetical protein SAMN05216228_102847 [Rhizobium tibeticum]|uniref:Uncharacterized protein n=1 Tax=Rhizobium tibeticum TaxID=501024 RepID=A0A1H8TEC8_9HYPH|nr:hypothetical protein RTCCBAU85039_5148 [Rhizobium tibeticum]SEO88833.1 hypothetical protein SAMN05216228_102847 [Rhizobium tibeticum]
MSPAFFSDTASARQRCCVITLFGHLFAGDLLSRCHGTGDAGS